MFKAIQSNQSKNYFQVVIGLILIALFAFSLQSCRTANEKVLRDFSRYPKEARSACISCYPVKASTSTQNDFIQGKPQIIYEQTPVDCSDLVRAALEAQKKQLLQQKSNPSKPTEPLTYQTTKTIPIAHTKTVDTAKQVTQTTEVDTRLVDTYKDSLGMTRIELTTSNNENASLRHKYHISIGWNVGLGIICLLLIFLPVIVKAIKK